FPIGFVCVRVVGLRGSHRPRAQVEGGASPTYLPVRAALSLGENTVQTRRGVAFSRSSDCSFCFEVRRPDAFLAIDLSIDGGTDGTGVGLGCLSLSLGELHEGGSAASPSIARRGWYAVEDVPKQFVVAAEALERRERAAKIATSGEPEGLFLCVESSF